MHNVKYESIQYVRTIQELLIILLKRRLIWLSALLFLHPAYLHSEITRLYLQRHYPVLEAENHVWIGTPRGLYRYNPGDDSFKRFSLPANYQNREVRQLYYNDEWLWCVIDNGLAALHIRLNEWLIYNSSNGLPSNTVNGLDFQNDYVWVASDSGAARFDILIEEWEIYDQRRGVPTRAVNDILTEDDQIWLISGKGFSEYDSEFEKWRHYTIENDTTAVLKRLFSLAEDIWLVSDQGLIRFNPELNTQQRFFYDYLTADNLIEIFLEDNRIWALTRSGLVNYDQITGLWREFEGNSYLKAFDLINASIDREYIWMLTDQDVHVWNRSDKYWDILDYASGLSASHYQSVYANRGMVFLFDQQGIHYRSNEQEPWLRYSIERAGGIGERTWRQVLKDLFDNEAGAKIPLGKYDWSCEGTRMTFIHDYQKQYLDIGEASDAFTASGQRLDVKSQFILGASRNISGFYNNIDYSETMYGVRYSDRDDNIVRELNWGDFRREPGQIPFGEAASIFGSDIWLRAGPKTPRFKRSLISLKAHTGERRSQKTYESYKGVTDQNQVTFRDIDYSKGQFYAIPGLDTIGAPNHLSIYVDDLNYTNNTANTLKHETIAGVTGDFDLWKRTEDYYFYKRGNVIRFLKSVSPDWTITTRFSFHGRTYERALQYANVITTASKNIYLLGGTSIIPFTFQLDITDTSGVAVPLHRFKLDDNRDGRVDPDCIDYEMGILMFPEPEPFPPEVYDPQEPQSLFDMMATFQAELPLIQLNNRNLVRGSEVLKLDGIIAIAGNDYVLDYTNGTLVFVREGIVSSDTRIEIEYEYYIGDKGDQIHSAALNWSPSDNFSIQGDWLEFSDENARNGRQEDVRDLFTLHSEVRGSIQKYDLRIIPGLAYTQGDNRLTATNLEGLVSSSRIRFQSIYQNYSRDYRNLYQPQSILGDVKSRLEFATAVDVRKDVRLSAEWRKVAGFADRDSESPTDESGSATLLFHKQQWPGWRFSYKRYETRSNQNVSDRYFFENNWEYELPERWSRTIGLKGLKTEAFLRTGRQSWGSASGSEEQKFREGYIRLNAMIREQFQGGMFYRRNDLNDVSFSEGEKPVSRSERLIFDLTHEEWRLLQMNLRVENSVTRRYHPSASSKNVDLNQYSQANFRFSPGRIWHAFSPFHFEFNYSQSMSGWGVTRERVGSWLWKFLGLDPGRLENAQVRENCYIKNEFRPSSRWLLYSLLEWSNQETKLSGSNLENGYWRWSEKLDLKLGLRTRMNVQYRQFHNDLGYQRTDRYWEPSLWVERRWTPDFLNIASLLYRYRQADETFIQDDTHNWETRYDLIWRRYRFLGIRRLEVRQSFGGTYRSTEGTNPERVYEVTSSSSIDLFPLHSMIFRLQFDLSKYIDDLFPDNSFWSVMLNLKTTLRF